MKVLLVSADPRVRETMALAARSVLRSAGPEPVELFSADNGLRGMAVAWARRPDIVVVDEIMSKAGAFALTKDLKGADPPFGGRIVVLLDRSVDEWLAEWAGADAWFVKPVDPFALADTLRGFASKEQKEAG
jgi:DNA-binding NarL/FixJ family response regulator